MWARRSGVTIAQGGSVTGASAHGYQEARTAMSLAMPSPSTTLSMSRVAPTAAATTTTVRASARATGRRSSPTSVRYSGATPGACNTSSPRRSNSLGSACPPRHACSTARSALEHVRHRAGCDAYYRIDGVERLGAGGEQAIHCALGGQAPVACRVPRVMIEVLARPELQRVDEAREDDSVGALARSIDEPQVCFVEKAHRGDEPDAVSTLALGARPLPHLRRRADFVHYFATECSGPG